MLCYLDASDAGTLSQHLLEADSLGLPILIADASGKLDAELLMVNVTTPLVMRLDHGGPARLSMAQFNSGYMGELSAVAHFTTPQAQRAS